MEKLEKYKSIDTKTILQEYNASDIIQISDKVLWLKDKEFWNINNFKDL